MDHIAYGISVFKLFIGFHPESWFMAMIFETENLEVISKDTLHLIFLLGPTAEITD